MCAPSQYSVVVFPGLNRKWLLYVAKPSAPLWRIVAQIMAEEHVLFLEAAGGTYNCRPPSLHAYGLALDLNPSKNPYRCPMKTNMPARFIERIESIRANGKQAIMWGGRWPCSNPPDPMHFQVNVAPGDIKNITYDGGQMAHKHEPMPDDLPRSWADQTWDAWVKASGTDPKSRTWDFYREDLSWVYTRVVAPLEARVMALELRVRALEQTSGGGGVSEARVREIIAASRIRP